ncbi:MAG TPA: 2-aminobenzoate-CoA ligase [Gammaproteobacteria bacterium]|jgi:2-aminobenzoate-CoA ligase|nr:AMP-binding protein [Gammaproteobacteria bacterium]RTZ62565.1 MAG: 2-aminobenzoate-CoA ligase [Gammaproteobacteria bacterium]HBK75797.1 2-aminobenzoate-CoA ligase [Gammaproteobacteria bacterium]HIM87314.1 2-aminobenzoate-CoA ligase [Gammaproteobacteria bacterium]HIM97119.1 2-aminobenzoate-CoA ligase [Gammaproteobacteria bacterium]
MGEAIDTFARENLPAIELWPEIDLTHSAYHYPDRFNCVTRFLDQWIERGEGHRTALVTPSDRWTYDNLYQQVNRIAHVLVEDYALAPGNRVLLRSANNPMMLAAYLAVIRVGGIAVGTMPLLRSTELSDILNKARITHALCDWRLRAELEACRDRAQDLTTIGYFHSTASDGLEALMDGKPTDYTAFDSAIDDICLIAFTSGTTGQPKGTMHFHRDLLAICDGFNRMVLRPEPDDIFCGSPPLAFTFGLGGMALFPLDVGAAVFLLEKASPAVLLEAIEHYRATICFTAPTAYRAMLPELATHDVSSLRKAVSAGEHLPAATFNAFFQATGIKLIDGLGSTEMLHVFVTAREEDMKPGATGIAVPGYRVAILDDNGAELPTGQVGRLAVKGPTGCRYLADERQKAYVRDGWNLPGDTARMDEDGYIWYEARTDDMIVSSGYNVGAPEVENALLKHPAVFECGVVGRKHDQRGTIIKAYVVCADNVKPGPELVAELQNHVKHTIAPYKYPREVEFVSELPKTGTGKIQRFRLREMAQKEGTHHG